MLQTLHPPHPPSSSIFLAPPIQCLLRNPDPTARRREIIALHPLTLPFDVRSISLYRTVDFCALRRWHRFHSHRSLDDRVSPSYFLHACLQRRSEDEDIQQNPEAVSLLTPEQYRVTQQDGTERPFQNKEPGLYLDVCRASRYSRPSINLTAAPIGRALQHREASDEGDRGDGPGCGNGRDEAGGAARAAGSDKRRRRSGSCVGIHLG